jgi:hypothetical protein
MRSIEYFFWYCSGASFSILKRCPSESSKYVGIGATVFFTGLLAAISSSYAMYFVFDGYVLPIFFGVVWGLMIFNLDRFIVLSMRKSDSKWKEYLQATPRFLLAILIALVISKPLELKIFEKEIASELILLEQEILKSYEQSVNTRYGQMLDSMNQQINKLNQEINQKEEKRDNLLEIARQEADGTGGSGKVNPGPIYKIKKKNADLAQQELTELKNKNKALIAETKLKMGNTELNKNAQKEGFQISDMNGISFQLTALSRLGDRYPAIYFANLFIILLFIVLEVAPIMTKLISVAGPYDDLLAVREHFYRNYRKEEIYKGDSKLEELIMSNT